MDGTPHRAIIGDSSSWSVADLNTLRRRARLWLLPVFVALAAVVGSWIAVWTIERTFQQTLERKLEAIIASTANSVALWNEQQTLNAQILAEDDRIERLVSRLLRPRDVSALASAKEELAERLETGSTQFGFTSYTVISGTGETLVTSSAHTSFDEALLNQFSEVFCGESVFADPSSGNRQTDAAKPTALWVAAPIQTRRSDETLATLICEIPSNGQFQRTLAVSTFGETGRNYAVDRNGNHVGWNSTSREDSRGCVISLARTCVLNVNAAGDSIVVNANGLHDASGKRLVGGAKWLPDLGLGVVSTIDYDEAYASHNLFKRINALVTSSALLGSCIGLIYTWHLSRAQLRAIKAEQRLRILGQYSLEDKIGEGGMGEVYRATHRMLRRPTAVKLLPAEKSSPQTIERFELEVQLTSQLTHPNTISIYDYGRTSEGVFYYAMEYLDGIDLKKLVEREGAQPEARIVHILLQICGSLDEAHCRGLVHRDIKPANVILCQRGGRYDVAKVLDFGLVYDAQSLRASLNNTSVSGTPAFMSPESISSLANVDHRSDIYSIGAVAYFLLTGTYTFTGSTVSEVWNQQLDCEPMPPSVRTPMLISQAIEELTMRCLAIDSADRPQSIAEVEVILQRLQTTWSQDEAKARWLNPPSKEGEKCAPDLDVQPADTLAYAASGVCGGHLD